MRLRNFALVTVMVMSALPVMANTIYTYTGGPFTTYGAPYTGSDFVSASFTVASPLAANLSFVTITPLSFTFSNGVQTVTNANAFSSTFKFFSTDATGNIFGWLIRLDQLNGTILSQNYQSSVASPEDFTQFTGTNGNPYAIGSPGTWTSRSSNSPVPEPSTLLLLGTGVLGIIGAARVRFPRS